MHPLYGAVHVTHSFWSHNGIIYEPTCCSTLQHHITFIPISVSLWNDLADHVFDGVGLVDYKRRANVFLIGLSSLPPF